MKSNAARQHDYRTRQRHGRIVLAVNVDEEDVVQMLERAELLSAHQEHAREDIVAALQQLIARLCEWPA